MKKYCPGCKDDKHEDEFNKNSSRKDGLQRICRECTKKEYRVHWLQNKGKQVTRVMQNNKQVNEEIRKYKESKGCSKCNETRPWVLDFHHLDPSTKDFEIGNAIRYGKEKTWSEIEKCIILCKNCHSDFHHLNREEQMTIEKYLNGDCRRIGRVASL